MRTTPQWIETLISLPLKSPDRTCNFACSYCNPAFSSTWVKDVKRNGAHEQLQSDGLNPFYTPITIVANYTSLVKQSLCRSIFKWWDTDLHRYPT